MVERAPEILDSISDNCSDMVGDGVGLTDLVNHLRIYLFDDAIRLGSEEGLDCHLKFDEVLFGPFDLQPDQSKPFVGLHSSHPLGFYPSATA